MSVIFGHLCCFHVEFHVGKFQRRDPVERLVFSLLLYTLDVLHAVIIYKYMMLLKWWKIVVERIHFFSCRD
jgi:hypothetical protein